MPVRLVSDPLAFFHHDRHGRFLIPDFFNEQPMKNCGYLNTEEDIVELEDSQGVDAFFPLTTNVALGEKRFWKSHDPAFLKTEMEQPIHRGPLALWDLVSGRRLLTLDGYHLGTLHGAQLLRDGRLLTWARDFLICIWNADTGDLVETTPMPIVLDSNNTPIVSSRMYSKWLNAEREKFVTDRNGSAFSITLIVKTAQAERIEHYAPPGYRPYPVVRQVFARDQPHHRSAPNFMELENAEAGYSDSVVLADGRLFVGGISYGAKDHFYLWDGGRELTILLTDINDRGSLRIDGEVSPGVVQVSSSTGRRRFNTN